MRTRDVFFAIVLGGLWFGLGMIGTASAQTCGGGGGTCMPEGECTTVYTTDIAACGSTPGIVCCALAANTCTGSGHTCRASGLGGCEAFGEVPATSGSCVITGDICCQAGSSGGNACTSGGGQCVPALEGCGTGVQASRTGCTADQICCDPASGGPGAGSCSATACSLTPCVAPLANDTTKTSPTCPFCCLSASSNPPGPGPTTTCDPTKFDTVAGVCFPKNTGLSDKPVLDIVQALISWLLGIFGLIAILGFIIAGLQYLFAAGDESRAETAKRNMQYAIIGIIVALSGWIIIQAVDLLLKADPWI